MSNPVQAWEIVFGIYPATPGRIPVWSVEGDIYSYDSLVWGEPDDSDMPKPTREEFEAKRVELQNARDNSQYARDRAEQYPDIGDQLDDLFRAGAFSDEMAAKIQAVKDANPKPGA